MLSERDRIYHQFLAVRCRRGEQDAWRELIAAWQPRLFYFIRRLVPGEADAWDVLQQTWLAAHQNIKTLTDTRLLATWLYRIARNKAISLRRVRLPETMPEDAQAAVTDDADEQADFDNADAVHRGLDQLSLPHRESLTLHFLRDLSVAQIAQVLDIPEGTVKSRLFHAKRELRKVLEQQEAAR